MLGLPPTKLNNKNVFYVKKNNFDNYLNLIYIFYEKLM